MLDDRAGAWLKDAGHDEINDLFYGALYRHLETEQLDELEQIEEEQVEELRERVRPHLLRAVHAAADAVLGYNREVGTLSLDGGQTWWFITGGMSFGDDPTEAFGEIGLLDMVAAWDQPVPVIDMEEGR